MKIDMVMPKMGESITEGTILKWLVKEGDTVTKDEMILEISTDKVDSEIPAPVTGVLTRFLAREGDTIDVGLPIAEIHTDREPASAEDSVEETDIPDTHPEEQLSSDSHQKTDRREGSRFYSPVVMNIASENDLHMSELETIKGSGLNGRLTKKDILRYLNKRDTGIPAESRSDTSSSSSGMSGGVEIIPMDHVRKSIARHMVLSRQTSAHVSIYQDVNMFNVVRIRDAQKMAFEKREGFKLNYLPFIAESVIRALKEFPLLNASVENDRIIVKKYINLGIAVAVDYGLIVPNIFDAASKSLRGLAHAIHDVAGRARRKKLKPEEVQNGTFSISNFGIYGTTVGFPIINQPQVAILGIGALKKQPVVIEDAIAIRPVMYLSLTFDHRIIDGATGAQFLQMICTNLESYDPAMKV